MNIQLADNGASPYERAYAAVLELIADVPAGSRRKPGVCGNWSLHDLMGHLAYWDQEQAAELRAIAAGEPFVEESGDDVNAREVAKRADWPWENVMAEVAATHDELVPLLLNPGESKSQYFIHEHWEEHLEQILIWKEANNA